jgi:hypothetical protein
MGEFVEGKWAEGMESGGGFMDTELNLQLASI